jgi:hypothetical protein
MPLGLRTILLSVKSANNHTTAVKSINFNATFLSAHPSTFPPYLNIEVIGNECKSFFQDNFKKILNSLVQ